MNLVNKAESEYNQHLLLARGYAYRVTDRGDKRAILVKPMDSMSLDRRNDYWFISKTTNGMEKVKFPGLCVDIFVNDLGVGEFLLELNKESVIMYV